MARSVRVAEARHRTCLGRRGRAAVVNPVVRSGVSGDLSHIASLLEASGLDGSDLDPSLGPLFVAEVAGDVVGVIALESYGSEGLLRSLAVADHARGKGIGSILLDAMEVEASELGASRLWLLTTTASPFFLNRGWRIAPREEAPADILGTQQFRELCPDSAICMTKDPKDCEPESV